MKNLSDRMRAAVDSPPPSRIDLDSLIAGQQRRVRTIRRTGGLAVAASLVAVVATLPLLFSGAGGDGRGSTHPAMGSSPCPAPRPNPTAPANSPPPSGTSPQPSGMSLFTVNPSTDAHIGVQPSHDPVSYPSPHPTEACRQAVPRLAATLREALHSAAADVTADWYDPTGFVYDQDRSTYEANLTLTGPNGAGTLNVFVTPAHYHPTRDQTECPVGSTASCTYEVAPDGTILVTVDHAGTQMAAGTYMTILDTQVAIAYLADGTEVALYLSPLPAPLDSGGALPSSPSLPVKSVLATAQLAEIARSPGFTLFPKSK